MIKHNITIRKLIAISVPVSLGSLTIGSLVTKNYYRTHYHNQYIQQVDELRNAERRFVKDPERDEAFMETTTTEIDSIDALEKENQRWKEGRRR